MGAQLYRTGAVEIYVGVGNVGAIGSGQNLVAYLGTCEEYPHIELIPKHRNITSDESGDAVDDVAWMGEEAMVFADVNRYDENIYAKLAARPFGVRGVGAGGGPRGSWSRRAVGALMKRNNLTYQLWLQFPNAGLLSMGGGAGVPAVGQLQNVGGGVLGLIGVAFASTATTSPMPPGYRFPESYLVGPDRLDPLGSRARKVQLIWHCISRKLPRGSTTIPGLPGTAGTPGQQVKLGTFAVINLPDSAGTSGTPDRSVLNSASADRFLLYDHDMTALAGLTPTF